MLNLAQVNHKGGYPVKFPQLFLLVLMIAAAAAPTPSSAAPAAKKAAPAKRPATNAKPSQPTSGNNAALNNYATQLRQKMGGGWNYPAGNNHVTLTVKVSQEGSVSDMSLSSNPKHNEAEQKANDAFNSAQPLQALPAGVSAATITILFDSQADQWDGKGNISVKIDPVKSETPANDNSSSGENKEEKK